MKTVEVEDFLGDKSITLSFRLRVSDLKKLLKGEHLTIVIKKRKFNIQMVD